MTDRDLNHLVPEFRAKVEELLERLLKTGYTFVPYVTLRSPVEQARLYCQSRTSEQCMEQVRALKRSFAPNIAKLVYDAIEPKEHKAWATNAVPGLSWHQFGEAVDCYYSVNGKAVWNSIEAYKRYAHTAQDLGLTAGLYFSKPDGVHVQLQQYSSPLAVYSLKEIDEKIKEIP